MNFAAGTTGGSPIRPTQNELHRGAQYTASDINTNPNRPYGVDTSGGLVFDGCF